MSIDLKTAFAGASEKHPEYKAGYSQKSTYYGSLHGEKVKDFFIFAGIPEQAVPGMLELRLLKDSKTLTFHIKEDDKPETDENEHQFRKFELFDNGMIIITDHFDNPTIRHIQTITDREIKLESVDSNGKKSNISSEEIARPDYDLYYSSLSDLVNDIIRLHPDCPTPAELKTPPVILQEPRKPVKG